MSFAAVAVGAALVVGGSAYGSSQARKSAKSAQAAQARAAQEMRMSKNRAIEYMQPYMRTGETALSPLSGLLTGQQYDPNTKQTTSLNQEQQMKLFQKSPGYQFRLEQAQNALQASQAAKGGLLSGGAMKEMNAYTQGIASDEYGNYINQLGGLAGMGQNAATSAGNFEIGAGSQIAGYEGGAGMARAQGYANQGSIVGGAMTQIGGSLMGAGMGGMGGGGKTPNTNAGTSNYSGGGQYNSSAFQQQSPNPQLYR